MASASRWVNVTVLLAALAAAGTGPSVPMVVGSSARLPVSNRVRSYSGIAGIAADFQPTDPEYLAGALYYSQPVFGKNLLIARRLPSATSAQLACGVLTASQQALANFTVVTAGSFTITIDGTQVSPASMNFSALNSLSAIAGAIQTALVAVKASTTCVWDATTAQFRIGSGTTGTGSTITVGSTPGTGTDISALIGSTGATGAQITNGQAAEATVTASLTAISAINKGWTAAVLASDASSADITAAAAYCQSANKLFFYTTSDANALLAVDTTSLPYTFKGLGYSLVCGMYSGQNANAIVAVMAQEMAVDFTGVLTTKTMWGKALVGVAPDNLNDTQLDALKGKYCNFYTPVTESNGATISMFAEGYMANGTFLDEAHGLLWLNMAAQSAVFDMIRGQATKLPQTDKGMVPVVGALASVGQAAVTNGLAAPGIWNGPPIGTIATGDTLDKGFYAYASPMAAQSAADRASRKAPPLYLIMCGAGALQGADVTITFQR